MSFLHILVSAVFCFAAIHFACGEQQYVKYYNKPSYVSHRNPYYSPPRPKPQAQAVTAASCVMTPSSSLPPEKQTVSGTVSIKDNGYGLLQLDVKISGLPKGTESLHGFHVHEFGDINGGCGSAGGHYNPTGVNHAAPDDLIRHVGDLGNLRQDLHGNINVRFYDRVASLTGPFSIVGRALVLHEGEDDLGRGGDAGSLANGNAGARLACCVIGVADRDKM